MTKKPNFKKTYTEDGKMFVTQSKKTDSDYQDIYIGLKKDGKHGHLGITNNQTLKFVQHRAIIKRIRKKVNGIETVESENLENGKITRTLRLTTDLERKDDQSPDPQALNSPISTISKGLCGV
jgi:hypothetical protein